MDGTDGTNGTNGTTEDTEYTESGDEKMGVTTNEVNPLLATPDLSSILSAISQPTQGLTAGQKDVMKARLAAQGTTGLRNVLESLQSALGGSSPAFALNAARMGAGVGSDVAGKMADVDVGEAQANRAAELQRRGQMLQGAGLQGQLFGIQQGAATSKYGIDTGAQTTRLGDLAALLPKMPPEGWGYLSSSGLPSYTKNPEYSKWAKLAAMLGGGGALDWRAAPFSTIL